MRRAPCAGLLVCLTGLCLSGCASTRLTQEPGLAATWDRGAQAPPTKLPPISVVVYTRQLRFETPVDTYIGPHWLKHSTQRQLEWVMREFPFLRDGAAGSSEETPCRLVIEATHATGGNKRLSAVSSFTKYLLPSSERNAVELEGRLLREGELLKRYEAVGTYKTRRHLLFLLLPMMWGLGVPGETTAETFRDLFLQIERDAGTLFAAAPEAPRTGQAP